MVINESTVLQGSSIQVRHLSKRLLGRYALMVLSVWVLLLSSSCGLTKALMGIDPNHYDIEFIEDYSEQIRVLRTQFPELYNLFRDGKIRITQMYNYKDKNGISGINVRYSFLSNKLNVNHFVW